MPPTTRAVKKHAKAGQRRRFTAQERLVRDLSRDFNKKVTFRVSGEDTELDRTVVEDIGDPLVHMVRNSLDHGLEMPADRLVEGSPRDDPDDPAIEARGAAVDGGP